MTKVNFDSYLFTRLGLYDTKEVPSSMTCVATTCQYALCTHLKFKLEGEIKTDAISYKYGVYYFAKQKL